MQTAQTDRANCELLKTGASSILRGCFSPQTSEMGNLLLIVLLVAAFAVMLVALRPATSEMFADSSDPNANCPTEAMRGADGRIHVKPGDRSFQTMADYTGYLADLYSRGATCLAPKVRNAREPVFGVFGGQGVGAIPPAAVGLESGTRAVLDTREPEETYAKTQINKLDDYEYSRIEQSERKSRNDMSTAVKNELLEGRKLDWANLPFNSEARAAAEDEFIAGRVEDMYRDPKTGVFFKNMQGGSLLPPDVDAERMREQKILSAYRPTELTKHTIDSKTEAVARLVNEMYKSDKKWQPVVSQVDENKWEVSELIPKPQKESYADSQVISLSMAQEKGMTVPPPEVNISDRLQDDPYFDKSGVGDVANNRFWDYKDFNKWTPGLERMFAPTLDNKAWH